MDTPNSGLNTLALPTSDFGVNTPGGGEEGSRLPDVAMGGNDFRFRFRLPLTTADEAVCVGVDSVVTLVLVRGLVVVTGGKGGDA